VARLEHAQVFGDDLCAEIRNRLVSLVEACEAPILVIDLSKVRELGSRLIGALVQIRKAAEDRGGRMALAQMSDAVAMSFRVAGLQKTLRGFDSVAEAARQLARQ
jgi:anti-anti-sigma factor